MPGSSSQAGRVRRLEFTEIVSPTFDGVSFGEVGPYESLSGSAWCDIDPDHPLNAGIVNLGRVPRDANGMVPYRVDLQIIRPVTPSRGNGWLFYEFPNRGTKRAIQRINSAPPTNRPRTAADAGNSYLMRQGYTLVWSGWQGELVRESGRMVADLPLPRDNGASVTGLCREEFLLDAKGVPQEDSNEPLIETSESSFIAGLHYPAATLDPEGATLTVRARDRDPRQTPPGLAFRFIDAMHIEITRPEGFDRGALYEFIYTARDPVVMGVGLASVRDIVSFLRHDSHDLEGNPNPLAGATLRALGFGLSQSGRVLREFLHEGLNEDSAARRVFDAACIVVSGARCGLMNAPFVQATRAARPHGNHSYPGDQFPFAYGTLTDPLTGRTDGVLARAQARDVAPKLIHVDSESEIWTSRASLVLTDGSGADIAQPDSVRVYVANGVPHLPYRQPTEVARHPPNMLSYHVLLRALLVALRDWVEHGTEPPPSRAPSRANGELVTVDVARAMFPRIPGVDFPRDSNELRVTDQSVQPPSEGERYPTFVIGTDADGNSHGGITHPLMLAPVGTHTGWQLRREGYAGGEIFNVFGAFLPFAETAAERWRTGDPRPSLEERYGTREKWCRILRDRMAAAVAERVLLQEDADRILAAAPHSWDLFSVV